MAGQSWKTPLITSPRRGEKRPGPRPICAEKGRKKREEARREGQIFAFANSEKGKERSNRGELTMTGLLARAKKDLPKPSHGIEEKERGNSAA